MDVFWLEQKAADVPVGDEWLSPIEQHCLQGFRFSKRRADWRLGRWTAKRAVAESLHLPSDVNALAGIEICASMSGAPEVLFHTPQPPITISISHSNGSAMCAVAYTGIALGCDLEKIEPRSDGFIGDYFTAEEQAIAAGSKLADKDSSIALLWSAKESVLKALHEGLRLDTRSVTIKLREGHAQELHAAFAKRARDTWHPLHARCANGRVFSGWWQKNGEFVRTLVAEPAPNSPILLEPVCSKLVAV